MHSPQRGFRNTWAGAASMARPGTRDGKLSTHSAVPTPDLLRGPRGGWPGSGRAGGKHGTRRAPETPVATARNPIVVASCSMVKFTGNGRQTRCMRQGKQANDWLRAEHAWVRLTIYRYSGQVVGIVLAASWFPAADSARTADGRSTRSAGRAITRRTLGRAATGWQARTATLAYEPESRQRHGQLYTKF